MDLESQFFRYLTDASVDWTLLDSATRVRAEQDWRNIYGHSFVGRTRAKIAVKAETEYRMEQPTRYLVVPFSSGVDGLPIRALDRRIDACECIGPLIELSRFHAFEFFVSPLDYRWTMVYTHEDHTIGGPYFQRLTWVNSNTSGRPLKSRRRNS